MSWDTDVVFADAVPGIATSAIGIGVAANWRGRWWRNDTGCGGSGGLGVGRSRDTDVVLADCRVRITTSAILVSVATEGNKRRG